jgi:hypothetical protein
MRVTVLGATALVASGVAVAIAVVQSLSSSTAQTQNRPRYLPEYTASGDLILPKDFHEWVYVGSPRWIMVIISPPSTPSTAQPKI